VFPFARLDRPRVLAQVAVFVAAGLLGAIPASSGPADPRNSHADPVLVGTTSGAFVPGVGAMAAPGFDVEVRSVNNAPLNYRLVTLTLNSPNLAFLDLQNPGVEVDCANRTIALMTDRLGRVCFGARICGFDNAPDAITVDADGVWLRQVPARSTDLWGMDGVTDANDMRVFRERFFSAVGPFPELDLNLDDRVDAADLQVLRDEYFRHAGAAPCP
jgi:hypothetical protein